MNNYKLEGDFKALSLLQNEHQNQLLNLPNIVGVGLSHKIKNGKDTKEPCITVFVQQKLPTELVAAQSMIPAQLGNYKTDVVEIGYVTAYSTPLLNARMRPFLGGFSIAHRNVTAGTAAALVVDRNVAIPSKYYILSNCHVLANSGINVVIGDPVLQPGPADGGVLPADRVGRLARFTPIAFGANTNNLVDCALCELDNLAHYTGAIHAIGYPRGLGTVAIGTPVQKTGRTTGYTKGTVTAINATISVAFGAQTARFVNQMVTTNMSAPGDSGSLVLDMNDNAVGLLFAGSAVAMIMNPIAAVLNSLNIDLV